MNPVINEYDIRFWCLLAAFYLSLWAFGCAGASYEALGYNVAVPDVQAVPQEHVETLLMALDEAVRLKFPETYNSEQLKQLHRLGITIKLSQESVPCFGNPEVRAQIGATQCLATTQLTHALIHFYRSQAEGVLDIMHGNKYWFEQACPDDDLACPGRSIENQVNWKVAEKLCPEILR